MNTLLSSNAVLGVIGLTSIFAICFVSVHLFLYLRQKLTAPPSPPPEPTEKPVEPEPVYYIVEKKKRRTRDNYSPPRRIDFK